MSDAALPRLSSLLPAVTLTWLVAASAFAEPRVLTSIKPLQLIAAAVQDGGCRFPGARDPRPRDQAGKRAPGLA